MDKVEVGVAQRVTPLRLNYSRSIIFYDMVDWYYRTDRTIEIHYEDIDDRQGIVSIIELHGTKSFTIGPSDKREIERCYLFYHQGTRL